MSLRIVTYATNSIYRAAAARLQASAQQHGHSVHVYTPRDRGSWWANVAHKAVLLAEDMRRHDQPLLYLDADCEIHGNLEHLLHMLQGVDCRVRHRPPSVTVRHNCGVMLLAANDTVRAFLNLWSKQVPRYGYRYDDCDQRLMADAAKLTGLRLADLPVAYNCFRSDMVPPGDQRISHAKLSREDPALSAWKECRRLEHHLVQRTIEWLSRPSGCKTTALIGPGMPLFKATAKIDMQAVGWIGPETTSVSWLHNLEDLSSCAASLTRPVLLPTDSDLGNTVDFLRSRLSPKPTSLLPPANIQLYYPMASLAHVTTRGELLGYNLWSSAINAAALRGATLVMVRCAPGLCDIVEQAAVRAKVALALW